MERSNLLWEGGGLGKTTNTLEPRAALPSATANRLSAVGMPCITQSGVRRDGGAALAQTHQRGRGGRAARPGGGRGARAGTPRRGGRSVIFFVPFSFVVTEDLGGDKRWRPNMKARPACRRALARPSDAGCRCRCGVPVARFVSPACIILQYILIYSTYSAPSIYCM
jgi:hypothetical protein